MLDAIAQGIERFVDGVLDFPGCGASADFSRY